MDTNKIKQLFNRCAGYGLILMAGLLLGWLLFSEDAGSVSHESHSHEMPAAENATQRWTCSMHPQIKTDKPGKCPICGMDLIPLATTGTHAGAIPPDAIQMSKEATALANIQTTVVSRQNPVKEIRLYGTVRADERLSQSQTSHLNGRIEKLFVNFTGERVQQGQTIVTIYSPELLSAQQELFEAAGMQSAHPALLQAAREKLRLWKLTGEQIAEIEQSGAVSPYVDIKATTSGVVVSKKVNEGDYINQGTVLFDIADFSRVWIMFDAYESDLPFLNVGDKLEYTLRALPGKTFAGSISFINPIVDPVTRTVKVRVETANPGSRVKPDLYAGAIVRSPLKQYAGQLVIPKSAVLWTGKRSIVYVKQPHTETPAFRLRQIELGPSLEDSCVIVSGIEEGDEIVTNGAFTVDASAQLEGKPSMMNDETLHPATGRESHALINVQGLCEMCKDRIEETAKAVSGVISAIWDQQSKQLHLNFNPAATSIDAIGKAVAKAGHDNEKYKADDKTYNALPECCKYRE
ncbi:MAG: efflux RND transporter periplasmic adaptor subunit [Tannerellaceae bacterium]|jgi:Cu(I)/Ag(I) efflux system membrane fusion protein|nr:efflux RND transporter periplasmic adaptor subunit [Tannerellaceae bacterium]